MATITVDTKATPLGTVRPPRHDLDVSNLNLQGERGMVARLTRSVTSIEDVMTIDGASTLTIKVQDYSRKLLQSELTRTRSALELDGIQYTLVKVSRDGNEVQLIFEELAINLLRRYSKPRKANRKNTNRAEFIRGMILEPHEAVIPFRCPELHERQPQLKPDIPGGSSRVAAASSSGPNPAVLAALRVKGAPADNEQIKYGGMIVQICKQRGGDRISCAGAVATAIQESTLRNLLAQVDYDSAGLYQQRPSVGAWGNYAQVTNPNHAINAFLDKYLSYRSKGENWLDASYHTQAPNARYRTAPAQWYAEGNNFAKAFMGSGGGTQAAASTGAGVTASHSYQVTRVEPYEFSRGTADQRETSWQCARRLADEVQWRFFCRGGTVWYVSDNWLVQQSPIARLSEFSAGVVELAFDWETRRRATEAKLVVLTRRYAIFPGDVIVIQDEGVGSGTWLVSQVTRTLTSQRSEISLVRKEPSLKEPAPATTTQTVTVNGRAQATSSAGSLGSSANKGVPQKAATVYDAAIQIHDKQYPYVWGGGHSRAGYPSGGGFDCSGSTVAALAAAGLGFQMGGGTAVSGTMAATWGVGGVGKYFTVYANAAHVWIRWNGMGHAWRFDTNGAGSYHGQGPRQRQTPTSTAGYIPRHWPGL
jgi:hypothetical protein